MTAASLQSHPLLWDWRRWGTDKSLWVPVVLIVQGWLYVSHFVHAFVPSDFPLQMLSSVQFCSLQLLSCVRLFAIPSTTVCQASLSITNSQSLLKLMSIESVMWSNHLILCHPLLLLPSIFPSIRVFPRSQFFTSGGQIIGVSASASVLPMNIQDWFPLGLTGLISLQSQGLFTVWKPQFFSVQPSLWFNSHIHTWLLEKPVALTIRIFVSKVMSLLFNTQSRFVIVFLPRSKSLLTSWLQSPSAGDFGI